MEGSSNDDDDDAGTGVDGRAMIPCDRYSERNRRHLLGDGGLF